MSERNLVTWGGDVERLESNTDLQTPVMANTQTTGCRGDRQANGPMTPVPWLGNPWKGCSLRGVAERRYTGHTDDTHGGFHSRHAVAVIPRVFLSGRGIQGGWVGGAVGGTPPHPPRRP